MSTKQRYLVSYKSLVPNEPNYMTFGVRAKNYNSAMTITKTFIYSKELHNHKDIDYVLHGVPSNTPAMYEIPSDDEDTIVIVDDKYNIDE